MSPSSVRLSISGPSSVRAGVEELGAVLAPVAAVVGREAIEGGKDGEGSGHDAFLGCR
jgi:hypothetical protein